MAMKTTAGMFTLVRYMIHISARTSAQLAGHQAKPLTLLMALNRSDAPCYGSTRASLNGGTGMHLQVPPWTAPGREGWPSIIGGRSARKFEPLARRQPGEHFGSSVAFHPSKFP
jgi:hypothetical protein